MLRKKRGCLQPATMGNTELREFPDGWVAADLNPDA
jgi:hypothetical protein